jgi:hypothetical protein
MADTPSIPDNTNWGEWTFEQVLAALTGEGTDLHSAANQPWFSFDTGKGAGAPVNYHAFGDYFVAVDFNQAAIDKWHTAFHTIDDMMGDVLAGKRGSMDLQTMRDLEMSIKALALTTGATGDDFRTWASALDSDDSAFRGKAAYLIHWRMKVNGDGMVDTHDQVTTRHGRPLADIVKDAGDGLSAFNTSMSNAWTSISFGLLNMVVNGINAEVTAAFDYMKSKGLFKDESNYALDAFGSADAAKTYIKTTLAGYSKGDLGSAGGWNAISDSINTTSLSILKNSLDTPSQTAISLLHPKYLLATSALNEITAPPPETMPQPDPGTNGPPDGGGGGGAPPPPGDGGGGGGAPPPPGDGGGGTGGLGGGGGGGDAPPPPGDGGGGTGDLGLGGGGDGGGGTGDLGLGGGGDGGGGGFMPGLVPPGGAGGGTGAGGGGSGVGPGSDGSFDEPGAGDGIVNPGDQPPGDGSGSLVPPGAGDSGTDLPPGSTPPGDGGGTGGVGAGAGAGGGTGGVGAGAGAGGGTGGFGSDPGSGAGGGGDGLGGVGGGAGDGGFGGGNGAGDGLGGGAGAGGGGFGGGGAGGGLGGGAGGFGGGGAGGGLGGGGLGGGLGGNGSELTASPFSASGGAPGLGGAGASGGSSSGNQAGGVPFYPPMMGGGGAGAGGDKPQERERQTWLSEEEEIWGTNVNVGSGVIGRLDQDDLDIEEVPLVGPVRGRGRPDTPRRTRPEREATAAEATAGEEFGDGPRSKKKDEKSKDTGVVRDETDAVTEARPPAAREDETGEESSGSTATS